MILFILRSCIVFSICLLEVTSFSAGVPPLRSVCLNMLPHHDTYKPQTSEAPFTITTDLESIAAGEDIIVTLNATSDITFKGFYLQARDDSNKPIGRFVNNDLTKSHSCGGLRSNAAHHGSGKVEKRRDKIRWTSPRSYSGDVTFIGTFVKDYVTIWAGVYSQPVAITPSTKSNNGNSDSVRRPGNFVNGILDFISGLGNRLFSGSLRQ